MMGLATEVCKVNETTQSILLVAERGYKKGLNKSGWILKFKKRTASRTDILQELISSTDNLFKLLKDMYESIPSLKKEEADLLLPEFIKIREQISDANHRLKKMEYINDVDLKRKYIEVVRLVNRIEARGRMRKN